MISCITASVAMCVHYFTTFCFGKIAANIADEQKGKSLLKFDVESKLTYINKTSLKCRLVYIESVHDR